MGGGVVVVASSSIGRFVVIVALWGEWVNILLRKHHRKRHTNILSAQSKIVSHIFVLPAGLAIRVRMCFTHSTAIIIVIMVRASQMYCYLIWQSVVVCWSHHSSLLWLKTDGSHT